MGKKIVKMFYSANEEILVNASNNFDFFFEIAEGALGECCEFERVLGITAQRFPLFKSELVSAQWERAKLSKGKDAFDIDSFIKSKNEKWNRNRELYK